MSASLHSRETLELNGDWDVAESLEARSIPKTFQAKAPIPGLVNLAVPPFPYVDEFDGYELIAGRVQRKELPEAARIAAPGHSRQSRNYFWFRRWFVAPGGKAHARLRIAKAQFGTAVWLNGNYVGEDPACFSALEFDLTVGIVWAGPNELLIRIGAHPGVLPPEFPAGADFEKARWTPGIYDHVNIHFCTAPVILSVQVAPRIHPPSITVATIVSNPAKVPCQGKLTHRVRGWREAKEVAHSTPGLISLTPGETKTFTETFDITNGRLWTTDDPYLYIVQTATGGDDLETRFGLREFRSDAASGRFYLNGEPCYLRGSNIALHRFFEDSLCGSLPWNDAWVRRLLGEIPRQLGWNSFRFTIGPVPDRWLEIADECGLLIQNEFFIWTSHPKWYPGYGRKWDREEMTRQFKCWVSDNWNHPSLVIWDACNETWDPLFDDIVREVRGLDLSERAWDNGYNAPAAQNDPAEIHTYFFASSFWENKLQFHLSELETKTAAQVVEAGSAEHNRAGHPLVMNEYGWLWLHRDGGPTAFTASIYEFLLGTSSTATDRFALLAYILAAETEFYRSLRAFAGVQHFVYLTCTHLEAVTADNFSDVRVLRLEPHFADWVGQAFQPLGVCLWFFSDTLPAGKSREFKIVMINDTRVAVQGRLTLQIGPTNGAALGSTSEGFTLPEWGRIELKATLIIPSTLGRMMLLARAEPVGPGSAGTRSRRWVQVVDAK